MDTAALIAAGLRRYSGSNSASRRRLQCRIRPMTRAAQAGLFEVMEHRVAIEKWRATLPTLERVKLSHPSTVLRHWKKANAPSKPAGEARPTTSTKTEQALAEAHEKIDHLDWARCQASRPSTKAFPWLDPAGLERSRERRHMPNAGRTCRTGRTCHKWSARIGMRNQRWSLQGC
jgi:hypothetical protein